MPAVCSPAKDNWLKMPCQKMRRVCSAGAPFGFLRVETVINSPREFNVCRCRERQGVSSMVWCPMDCGAP